MASLNILRLWDLLAELLKSVLPDVWFSAFGLPEIAPEMISIRAGTLDDPSLYQPRAEVFVSQAYAWDTLNPNLRHFEKMIEKSKK